MPVVADKSLELKGKVGHGSFVINLEAISILTMNKASADEICAFMVLSCFTDKNYGKYHSTAGYSSIVNRLGVSARKAKDLILRLSSMELNGSRLLSRADSVHDVVSSVDQYD